MVSNEVGQPGFNFSGYTNISTSDGIVHGQVKQSGPFSFVRIYESGHVSIVEAQICPFELECKSGYICWECSLSDIFLGSDSHFNQALLMPISFSRRYHFISQ